MELKDDSPKETKVNLPAYVPTQEEKRTTVVRRKRGRSSIPKVKVTEKEKRPDGFSVREVGFDCDDQWAALQELGAAIGFGSLDEFTNTLVTQLAETFSGPADNSAQRHASWINFALSVIHDLKPKDTAEAMLAAQMTVGHILTMFLGTGVFNAKSLERQLAIGKQFNNFARTYAAQMQTLKVYRAKGKQSIVVKHVTVSHGGQAIIGKVKHGGVARVRRQKSRQPHEPS